MATPSTSSLSQSQHTHLDDAIRKWVVGEKAVYLLKKNEQFACLTVDSQTKQETHMIMPEDSLSTDKKLNDLLETQEPVIESDGKVIFVYRLKRCETDNKIIQLLFDHHGKRFFWQIFDISTRELQHKSFDSKNLKVVSDLTSDQVYYKIFGKAIRKGEQCIRKWIVGKKAVYLLKKNEQFVCLTVDSQTKEQKRTTMPEDSLSTAEKLNDLFEKQEPVIESDGNVNFVYRFKRWETDNKIILLLVDLRKKLYFFQIFDKSTRELQRSSFDSKDFQVVSTLTSDQVCYKIFGATSKIDKRSEITEQNWAVTLVCGGTSEITKWNTWAGHAMIAIEGVSNCGTPFLHYAHLCDTGVVYDKNMNYGIQSKTETWIRTKDQVQKMLRRIEWEREKENKTYVEFYLRGCDSIFAKPKKVITFKDSIEKGLAIYQFEKFLGSIPLPERNMEMKAQSLVSKLTIGLFQGNTVTRFMGKNNSIKVVSKDSKIKVYILPDNCITWARKKLSLAGVDLIPTKIGAIFTPPKAYTVSNPTSRMPSAGQERVKASLMIARKIYEIDFTDEIHLLVGKHSWKLGCDKYYIEYKILKKERLIVPITVDGVPKFIDLSGKLEKERQLISTGNLINCYVLDGESSGDLAYREFSKKIINALKSQFKKLVKVTPRFVLPESQYLKEELKNWKQKSKMELLKRTIALNPSFYPAYVYLATILPIEKSTTLEDGTNMTKEALYKRALTLCSNSSHSPHSSHIYCNLATCLPLGGRTTLEDGTSMTREALYKRGITLDSSSYHAYFSLGAILPKGGSTILEDGTEMTKEALYKRTIALDPSCAPAYSNLGVILPERGSTILEDGTKMTQEALHKRSIALNPNYAPPYCCLVDLVPMGGSTKLEDGTSMTQEALYKRIIALDPSFAPAYFNLGGNLSRGDYTTLEDGTKMTHEALYKRVIALDPSYAIAYNNLANLLPRGGRIILENETKITKEALYKRSIALDPNYAIAYYNLANQLPDGVSTTLENETKITKEALFKKSIALDPVFAAAYINLGATLPKGGSTTLEDGTKITKEALFKKSIALDPSSAIAYYNLANQLPNGGSTTLENKKEMSPRALYKSAIKYNSNYAASYFNLGTLLTKGERTQLDSGVWMTRENLYQKATLLDPSMKRFLDEVDLTQRSN